VVATLRPTGPIARPQPAAQSADKPTAGAVLERPFHFRTHPLLVSSLSELVNSRYTSRMRWPDLQNEPCPVARGLSVIGDRWTMLILRECFFGIRRFDRIHERLGITRHVLAGRLRKLEANGVLRREPYQERPVRYEYRLTEKGKSLYPVLVTLIDWADAHVPAQGGSAVTLVSQETQQAIAPKLIDAQTGGEITLGTVRAITNERPRSITGAVADRSN
jgi:DNA-binding HxlR family transcriptional regulator